VAGPRVHDVHAGARLAAERGERALTFENVVVERV
jgi:hypothetical protein